MSAEINERPVTEVANQKPEDRQINIHTSDNKVAKSTSLLEREEAERKKKVFIPENERTAVDKARMSYQEFLAQQQKLEIKEQDSSLPIPRDIEEQAVQDFYHEVQGGPVEIVYGDTGVEGIRVDASTAKIILPDAASVPPTLEQLTQAIRRLAPRFNDSQLDRAERFTKLLALQAEDPTIDEDTANLLRKNANSISIIVKHQKERIAGTSEFTITNVKLDVDTQFIEGFAKYVTKRNISVERADVSEVSVMYTKDQNGDPVIQITLPKDATLHQIAEVANQLHPEGSDVSLPQRTREYAERLQRTAVLMAQRGQFSDTAIQTVYNAGAEVLALEHPEGQSQFVSAEEIRQQAKDAVFTQEEQQAIYFEMFLGEEESVPGSQHPDTFLYRYFPVWQKQQTNAGIEDVSWERYKENLWERRDALIWRFRNVLEHGLQEEQAEKNPAKNRERGNAQHSMQEKLARQNPQEQVLMGAELETWRHIIDTAGHEHSPQFAQQIHRALAEVRLRNGSIHEELLAITRFYQDTEGGQMIYAPSEAIPYFLDAENPDLENGEPRKEKACIVVDAHEVHRLEREGYTVYVPENYDTHIFFYVIKDGQVFKVDPKTPKGDKPENVPVIEITDTNERDKILRAFQQRTLSNDDVLLSALGYNYVKEKELKLREGKIEGEAYEEERNTITKGYEIVKQMNPTAIIIQYAEAKWLDDEVTIREIEAKNPSLKGKYEKDEMVGNWPPMEPSSDPRIQAAQAAEQAWRDRIDDCGDQLRVFREAHNGSLATLESDDPHLFHLREVLVDEVNRLMDAEGTFDAMGYSQRTLEAAKRFEYTRCRAASQMIMGPYKYLGELNDYEISFYAQPRLQEILDSFKKYGDIEGWEYYLKLKDAAKTFHIMNKFAKKGEIEKLVQIADEIQPETLETMRRIPGTGVILGFFEDELRETLARKNRITAKDYAEIKNRVRNKFYKLNEANLILSEFANERSSKDGKMQPWEIDQAWYSGRAFMNNTYRTAIFIGMGGVASGSQFGVSNLQEKLVSTLYPFKHLLKRWTIGAEGGMRFIERVQTLYGRLRVNRAFHFKLPNALRLTNGLDSHRKLSIIGGANVDDIEDAKMLALIDFLSGYRIGVPAFNAIKTTLTFGDVYNDAKRLDADKLMTINEWLDAPHINKGDILRPLKKFLKIKDKSNQQYIEKFHRSRYPLIDLFHMKMRSDQKKLDKFLVDNLLKSTDLGMGILIKSNLLKGSEGFSVRRHAWIRLANPRKAGTDDVLEEGVIAPVFLDYLSNIEASNRDKKTGRSTGESEVDIRKLGLINLKTILEKASPRLYISAEGDFTNAWSGDAGRKGLREKIEHYYARWKGATEAANEGKTLLERQVLYNRYMTNHSLVSSPYEFTPAELAIVNAIKAASVKLAPHIADIEWNTVPTHADTPWSLIDFGDLNANEFSRNAAADKANQYKASGGITGLVDNPGNITGESLGNVLDEVRKQLADVEGKEDAQKMVFPLAAASLQMTETALWTRIPILSVVLTPIANKLGYGSEAQVFNGSEAQSNNAHQTGKIVEQLVGKGIISRRLGRVLKWWTRSNWLLLFLIDLFPDFLLASVASAGAELGKVAAPEEVRG